MGLKELKEAVQVAEDVDLEELPSVCELLPGDKPAKENQIKLVLNKNLSCHIIGTSTFSFYRPKRIWNVIKLHMCEKHEIIWEGWAYSALKWKSTDFIFTNILGL